MKISFHIDNVYLSNNIFDINSIYNRDNCFSPYIELKKIFTQYGYDISTSDINSIDDSSVVIYNDIPKILPKEKDIHKSYLLLFESKLIRPDNWDLEKHKYFNKIFTWDDRYVDNKKYFKLNFSHLFPDSINKDLSKKKKLCTLIAGNKMVAHPLELYSKRVEAIKWFEKNHLAEFDFYGVGWDKYIFENRYVRYIYNKMKLYRLLKPYSPAYKGKIESKKEVLTKYRFAICYENARNIDGYITEKIFDCFFAGCIPVYWGANNIEEHIPKNCFIDKREFENYETLYEFMIGIDDSLYLKYLNDIESYLRSEDSSTFSADYFANTIVNNILDDKISK